MSKIRDDAFLSFWEKYGAGAHTDSFMHGWRAALDAVAKVCDAHGAMTRVAAMLRDPEFRWPGDTPQADDDPNDCHDWTPKGM